ncbi:hypothetical protein [Photobacterium damselae]|uniref:hypothetical protein n=1 Tax=Photobacterium damselae TaxID=38293 RepID=UPI00370C55AC
MDSTICDIANIDATGQTFRYPKDIESRKHLVEVSSINLIVLKRKFDELERNLDKLFELTSYLIDEYSVGSFTKKLSRFQLLELSNDLPYRDSWKTIDFNHVKSRLRIKYGLSSNDFSKAVKIIESNYEMSKLIGIIKPLKAISEKKLLMFFDEYVKLNPLNISKGELLYSTSFLDKNRFERIKLRRELENHFSNVLLIEYSREEIADIISLSIFGVNPIFSEYYALEYECQFEYLKKLTKHDYKNEVFELLDKTSIIINVLKSLYFLGKRELADLIADKYEIEKIYGSIDNIRTNNIF